MKNIFNFSKANKNQESTGIYVFKGEFKELSEMPGNGSINSIIDSLGYDRNLVHVVHVFNSKKISCIGVKLFSDDKTNQIIFALAKDKCRLNLSDVYSVMKMIDWEFEYSALNIEEMMEEGIENENLSKDFLLEAADIVKINEDTYESNRFGLYLRFKNNVLVAFSSATWENAASKWLKDLNQTIFNSMLMEAMAYHKDDWDAMREVNIQCDCILDTPSGLENEFLENHRKDSGNINFYNLLVVHHNHECLLDDFLFVNKGRCIEVDSNIYKVGSYLFSFDNNGILINVSE